MAVPVLGLLVLLLLAMADRSAGNYCVCNSGVPDATLQKNIDYACGAGADCTPILQNGACYNPNTLRDHCNYAVNSYYQRRGQQTGSCDFLSTASVVQNSPSTSSGCVYPSSASGSTPNTPTTGTPSTNTGTTVPGSTLSPPGTIGGIAPVGFTDNNGGVALMSQTHVVTMMPVALIVLMYGCLWPRF